MGYGFMAVALACWTALAFAYRWADRLRANRLVMSTAMGCAAIVWVLLYAQLKGVDLRQACIAHVILGCGLGVLMVLFIPVFMAAVARGDISITWTVLTLSFAVASVMAIVYPGEPVTALGMAGLVIVFAAVVLLGIDMYERHRSNGPGKPRKGWFLFMGLSFAFNALCLYTFKLSEWLQPNTDVLHHLVLLLSAYVVLAAGSLVLALFIRRRGSARTGVMTGTIVGSILVTGGFCTLQALSVGEVPAHVLFPTTNGGSSVLVVVLSVILLRERPGRFGWMGIAAGATALVLLGLATPS